MSAARLGIGFAVALACAGVAGAAPAHAAENTQAVVVEGSSVGAAAHAVSGVGGKVDAELPIVSGVAAHVSPAGMNALDADASVVVTPDVTMHPTSDSFDPSAVDTQLAAVQPSANWSRDAGSGVGVALVDTGVADTPDLHAPRLVRAPDFSGEGDGIDHYGHGTFMAGLIAGDGTASAGQQPQHFGVAPGATLISVKVARADGSSSLSRVLEGIGWVVTHRDAYNIGVLNLSFGVDTPLPYLANPLSGAVEAAWASGITVVASAGNEGNGDVTSPGDDPYVITVGAADTAGTVTTNDDSVPAWSGHERFFFRYAKPDVVAPGVSVVSLRAPGSTVDTQHPEGRVDDTYFRGTGTSMSTAMVSGAAAVLLSHHGNATPDDVKGSLVSSATTIAGGRMINLDRADHATAQASWWQHFPVAFNGLDRGFDQGMPWTATRWTNDSWAATRWTATRWTATRWTATRWTTFDWEASRWTASRWTASRWTASRWTASRWTSDAWPSQSWG